MSPPISPSVKDESQASPRTRSKSTLRNDANSVIGDAYSNVGDAYSNVGDAYSNVGDAYSNVGDAISCVIEKRRQLSLDGTTDLASLSSSCDALKMKTSIPGK